MKKLLAMVLALVMTLSLAVSANALKADEKINDNYAEAVAVLDGMGVFKGYEDGSFKPENKITRAEVATIIYRIYTQDLAKNDKSGLYASYNKFSDMAGAGWAAGYIGYCANAEFVKGYPDGTFKPSGNVTGYEVLTMILRAIGYDKNNEFTGADWALNVAKYAEQAGVLANVKGVDLNAPATRELVAELLFRAIAEAPMVTYTAAFGYQTVSFNGKADGKTFKDNETLGHKKFDLTPNATNGTYGRPATKWTYNCGDKSTVVYDTPVATYTEKFSACDLCKDLSQKKEAKVTVAYVDGKETSDLVKTYSATDTKDKQGAQGQLVEVYENEGGKDYTMVAINTYLGEVSKVYEADKDKNNHGSDASVDVKLYNFDGKYDPNYETSDFEKKDMVLVTVDYNKTSAKYEIASVEDAKSESAELNKIVGVNKTTTDVQDILKVGGADVAAACKAVLLDIAATIKVGNVDMKAITIGESYTFYYDTYGNVIGVSDYAPAANYVVIDELWKNEWNGKDDIHATLVGAADAKSFDASVAKVYAANKSDITDQVRKNEKDNRTKTTFYYNLMSYTLNSKDEYVLTDVGSKIGAASYTFNDRYIDGGHDGKVFLNKDTVILFQSTESPNGTFTNYTYKTLPSFTGLVDYVEGKDGYADVVYVYGALTTDSYIFLPDVVSKNVCTIEKVDDDVYALTIDGKVLNDKGELEDKTITIKSEFGSFPNGPEAFGADHAGLYAVQNWGDDYAWLSPCTLHTVDEVHSHTSNNQRVTDIIFIPELNTAKKDNSAIYFDDEDTAPLYTRWLGDYTAIDDCTDGYSTSVDRVTKNASSDDLQANDLVYVQIDKDNNVVAVYDMYYEVDVAFKDADKNGVSATDKAATITDLEGEELAPMYYKKALKDFNVNVSEYVYPTLEGQNASDYASSKKPEMHNVKRAFTFTAAENALVKGDITVALVGNDFCAGFKTVDDITAQNLKVSVSGSVITVENTVPGTAATVSVDELQSLLSGAFKTECGNTGVVSIKDNSVGATGSDPITAANAANLKVTVTVAAEKISKDYTVSFNVVNA